MGSHDSDVNIALQNVKLFLRNPLEREIGRFHGIDPEKPGWRKE